LILLVDDDPIVVLRMREVLSGAHYEVVSASDGLQALALAKELRPDLVLLDIDMPRMSGIEACAELKQNPRTWRTRVVLLTASDDPRHLRDGFRAGCDGYVAKGTPDGELLRKLSVKLLPGTSLQAGRR
jgi:CheY-like chemotaxis protein